MKYSYNWLKDYYQTDKTVEQTGEDLVSLGSDVEEIFPSALDSVLELEITPNRGDLLSHFGLARDLSAKAGRFLEKPKLELVESSEKTSDEIKIEIESDKCPLYLARIIKSVKIAPSPKWLQTKLAAVGAKPINNVVDATNYIMLDLGHPLHAFDQSKITDGEIVVKEASEDMEVVTLDGEAREIISEMLGIWDGERPIAIAGVMGLANSEVGQDTTDIVLEAAVFDRKSIRKTAKLLNLKTEASARFERGVDEGGVKYAIDKAAKMIAELAGGEVLSGIAGNSQSSVVSRRSPLIGRKQLKIEYDKINSYANLNLEKAKINQILENLGFLLVRGSDPRDHEGLTLAEIPAWRHDIAIWQDLAEEIYRINGLEKISALELPAMQKAEPSDYYEKEKIKDYLVELGLDEAISYTFLSDADVVAAKLDSSDLLEVANPVQDENRYLRNSLIPGLLKAVAKNPSFDDIEFFEIGNVFTKDGEKTNLAIVTAGKSARKAGKIVTLLSEKLPTFAKATVGGKVKSEKFRISEIDREGLKRFKIKKPLVSVAEVTLSCHPAPDAGSILDLDKIDWTPDHVRGDKAETIEYRPISKFPSAKRDLAFVVDAKTSVLEIRNFIIKTLPKAVLVEIFDEFADQRFGENKKSVAFHIWLQDLDKTLSDSEADEEVSKIVVALSKKFGAKLRD